MENIVFAGGCFWCTEAVFKRLKGVEKVTSGYSGGEMDNPSYYDVVAGDTGHAEAVKIEFNPEIISFEKLLEVFWATHDPTTLNQQGNDVGTQYRSAIYYFTDVQKEIAIKSKTDKENSGEFKNIVTEILPFKNFYPAEEYHQDFYDRNKDRIAYCPIIITPKINKLLEKFNNEVKDEYK